MDWARVVDMEWAHVVNVAGALFASVFIVTACTMKTMIPLRIFFIITNVIIINYGYVTHAYFSIFIHLVLLPINIYRLYEMLRLIKNVRAAIANNWSIDWLKPFMKKRSYKTGDIIFKKGDVAKEMFYTVSGRYRLVESGIEIPPGEIVGELGMLSPSNQRTQTMECVENGDMLKVTYREVEVLYFQNPEFGFYFLRLATARLFHNIGQLEGQLAQENRAPAVK